MTNIIYSAVLLAFASVASAESPFQNEYVGNMDRWVQVTMKDGCSIQIPNSDDAALKYAIRNVERSNWTGDCVRGLAMGPGLLISRSDDSKPQNYVAAWHFYGRQYGPSKVVFLMAGDGYGSVHEGFSDGRDRLYRSVATPEPMEPGDVLSAPRVSLFFEERSRQSTLQSLKSCYPSLKPCISEWRFSPEGYAAGQTQILCGDRCGAEWAIRVAPFLKRFDEFASLHGNKTAAMRSDIEPLLITPVRQQIEKMEKAEAALKAEARIHRDAAARDAEGKRLAKEADEARMVEQGRAEAKAGNKATFSAFLRALETAVTGAAAYESARSSGLGKNASLSAALSQAAGAPTGSFGSANAGFAKTVVYINGPGMEVNRFYKPLDCVVYVPRSSGTSFDHQNNCANTVDGFNMYEPYDRYQTVGGGTYISLRPGRTASHSHGPKGKYPVLACLKGDSLLVRKAGDLPGAPEYDGHICQVTILDADSGTGTAQ